MKILIFGTGRIYQRNKEILFSIINNKECIGFVDNLKKGNFEGKPIYSPYTLHSINFDLIIIMSTYVKDMCEQLIKLNISKRKILSYKRFFAEYESGKLQIFPGNSNFGKRILIITHTLDYNGGAMVAIYAGIALQQKGYNVSIATSVIDRKLVDETNEKGLNVIYCKTLPFVFLAERRWIETFDMVIVNTFPMLPAAIRVSEFRPVLWWIHESNDRFTHHYNNTRELYYTYAECNKFTNIKILAVSKVAKDAFEQFYPYGINGFLPYGIPDINWEKFKKRTFSQIGIAILASRLDLLKAQDVFLLAIKMLPVSIRHKCKFYIIGDDGATDEYSENVRRLASNISEVVIKEIMTRREIQEFYPNIDVVVSASLVDSLPVVVTEGLMNGKICIVSDATGHAYDFIRDGINGFICKAGDVASLAEKMRHVIEHIRELDCIRKEARATYEKYFSMDVFGDRLEKEILKTEQEYWSKTVKI